MTSADDASDDGAAPQVHHDWLAITREANTLFVAGRRAEAIACYEQARHCAIERFGEWPDCRDAMAAMVVSCRNLAEASVRCGAFENAIVVLCALHAWLHRALELPGVCPRIAAAARANLPDVVRDLARFHARHGDRPEVRGWIDVYSRRWARNAPSSDEVRWVSEVRESTLEPTDGESSAGSLELDRTIGSRRLH